MKVVKFHIDDFNREYSVTGSAINDAGETITVGFYSSNYSAAYSEFSLYSAENGYECQRIVIRKV